MVNWGSISQQNQTKINKYNIRKNRHRVDHDYKVRDHIMLTKNTAYKYGTLYKGSFVITQCFTNGTVNLQCVSVQTKYNIRRIKPYKFGTKVDNFSSKKSLTMSTYKLLVIYFYLK